MVRKFSKSRAANSSLILRRWILPVEVLGRAVSLTVMAAWGDSNLDRVLILPALASSRI